MVSLWKSHQPCRNVFDKEIGARRRSGGDVSASFQYSHSSTSHAAFHHSRIGGTLNEGQQVPSLLTFQNNDSSSSPLPLFLINIFPHLNLILIPHVCLLLVSFLVSFCQSDMEMPVSLLLSSSLAHPVSLPSRH